MAEVFVYTCGEFPLNVVLRSWSLDAVCTMVIWMRVSLLTGVCPTAAAAAAHVLLRLTLSLLVHYCQQRPNLSWAWELFSSWRRQPSYPERLAAKANLSSHEFLHAHTPVYSSILCCNNPTMLSHIAAASGKDLEPVRLERLSSGGTGAGATQPPTAGQLSVGAAASTSGGGTETYDLARRLVSSAGAGGPAGASEDVNGYTSAARKVRVSVKIPDKSPEDLAPGWDTDLHVNGQRRAVVLFTYIRRGCIQLVLDLFGPAAAAGGVLTAATAGAVVAAPLPAPGAGVAPQPMGTHPPAPAADADSPGVACVGAAVVGLLGDAATPPAGSQPQPVAAGGGVGGLVHGQVLRAICSDALLAGRTLTLQVGATASLVQVEPAQAGAAAGGGVGAAGGPMVSPALQLPPDVRVRQQVVCTGGGWSALEGGLWPPWPRRRGRHTPLRRQREVLVACSWDAAGSDSSATDRAPHEAELQLTVRQQGRFLPVALMEAGGAAACARRSLRAALAEGNVAAVVQRSGSSARSPTATASPSSVQGRGARLLAFAPASGDGLAQVELSRGGCHSAQAASVLLVSSPAIAFELEQLQAVACSDGGAAAVVACGGGGIGGGLDLAAEPRLAMVSNVVRDLGSFLDIVPALHAACGCGGADAGEAAAVVAADGCSGSGSCSSHMPLFEWSLAQVDDSGLCAPVASRVVVLGPKQAGLSCAGGGGLQDYQERRALMLASVGCRMGLNLVRYFLSTGMAACATRVLDVLHHQLGVPPVLFAGEACCPERMTLLHHAARSGSFRTLAALAAWLEERGLEPGWDRAGDAGLGLTPLHLLAVVPGAEATCALTQLRWPAARRAWAGSWAAGAAPARFAAMARGCASAPWWERAAGAAPVAAVVGGAWRCAAAARRRLVPRRLAQACSGAVAPALEFMLPTLESSYVQWFNGRVAFMDHLFLTMYSVYCVAQMVKGGWAFFTEAFAGLFLLAARLSLLALHSPLWGMAGRRLTRRSRRQVVQSGDSSSSGSRSGSGSGERRAEGGASHGRGASSDVRGAAAGWLLASREGKAVLMELLRLAMMLLLAAGVMRLPNSWFRLVQLHLDLLINPFIRPMSNQMRLLPSLAASAVALVGEATITVVIWQSAQPVALVFALAFARGCISHGLGLGLTVFLQASARRRFLAEQRTKDVLPARKAG